MSEPTIKTISCGDLHHLRCNAAIDLIDVRTAEEFAEIHATGARNIPLDALAPAMIDRIRTTPATDPIYFICAVGGRSAWACEQLMAAGHINVVNVEGGTQAWYLAGLPVEMGG